MAITNAVAVAKFFLDIAKEREDELSPKKLQKLLYYAQGEYLGRKGEALFDDPIQAWADGPVQSKVYGIMQYEKGFSVKGNEIPDIVREHLVNIYEQYRHSTGVEMSRRTHLEQPWVYARKNLLFGASSQREIPKSVMKAFFAKSPEERERYVCQMEIMQNIVLEKEGVLQALADA